MGGQVGRDRIRNLMKWKRIEWKRIRWKRIRRERRRVCVCSRMLFELIQ